MQATSLPIAPALPATPKCGRVLVVDDDPTACLLMRTSVEKQGFAALVAKDIAEAKAGVEREGIESFDCVLTDYQMPGGNGIELLAWLQERDNSLATIIVTCRREKELVTQSLRSGACDFLDKPVTRAALQAATARAVALTRQRRRLAEAQLAVKQIGQFQHQMLRAEDARNLLPIDLCFLPQSEAGGDFLSRFQVGPDRHFILLTDVSGHDLQAAFLSAYFQGVVRGMLERHASILSIFEYFNLLLAREWNPSESLLARGPGLSASVAACALMIDLREQSVTVLTSGSPCARHVDAQGRIAVLGEHSSPPLGWFPESAFTSTRHSIAAQGSFVLWSDGLESLAEARQLQPCALATALLLARRGLRAQPDLSGAMDDILAARIWLSPDQNCQDGFLPVLTEQYHGGQLSQIDELAKTWRRHLLFCLPNLGEADLFNVVLASREAVLNAIKHGAQEAPELLTQFAISYHTGQRLLRVFVCDPGNGHAFDVQAHESVAAQELRSEHRGLVLIRHLCSRFESERAGASLTLDFQLAAAVLKNPKLNEPDYALI